MSNRKDHPFEAITPTESMTIHKKNTSTEAIILAILSEASAYLLRFK